MLLSVLVLANTDNGIIPLHPSSQNKIDSLVTQAIDNHVMPGCQIVALHHGKVVFDKCYGYLDYAHQQAVTDSTMYDVASVTKAAATTLAIMKLYEEGLVKLEDTIGEYLPYMKGTDKEHISIVELLTHTSGLPAYIPFHNRIANNNNYISNCISENYKIKVANGCYLRNDYQDSIRYRIAHCSVRAKQYVYSDINFFILKEIAEKITGIPLAYYLQEHFYHPMRLTHTCFNPLENGFNKSDIAPTELDTTFRHQVVQGYVHDQFASLMGGNAGNAGLFSTAKEMACLFQMLMNGGTYQGKRYFSEKTVELFTTTFPIHGCNRRALGFDTPHFAEQLGVFPSVASNKTYGHQGFTGTVVWCDPEHDILYVFFCNRVHPYTTPNKLVQSQLRTRVQQAIYDGLGITE